MVSVLFLYISCSSINPADPCIMKPKKDAVLNTAHLSSDKQSSEAGVFYCKLCESEVISSFLSSCLISTHLGSLLVNWLRINCRFQNRVNIAECVINAFVDLIIIADG